VLKADKLPPSCAVVKKSGNLNFLEPSGSVEACNGTDLPLHETEVVVTVLSPLRYSRMVSFSFIFIPSRQMAGNKPSYTTQSISFVRNFCLPSPPLDPTQPPN